ncbi:uncharacterized protein LOC111035507 [Myzus persicae]|uniref:uncharacterized protein LOC111035507 n=1 Tax=Myzus persicae TaxID=13164 RepID=UPI000B9351A4|nr:uncharacterized protein LOC111035507 [Myzus persicae]
MMAAHSEKPFDDNDSCFELLLFYYEIGKTIVFWTNVFLISSTMITGSFDRLCFATSKHTEMVVRRVYSMFRMKPLDMKHFQEDTMLMRQQRHHEKNQIEKFAWLKRRIIEKETQNERDQQFMIYDWLADALDFLLNTKSHNRQRYCDDLGEAESIPFKKSATKDLRSFRNLNTSIVIDALDTSTQQFICQECGLKIQR